MQSLRRSGNNNKTILIFLRSAKHVFALLRDEDLIIPESMTQDFGCTVVLERQAHSKLRNCLSGAAVQSKDQSDSGIIEFSSLRNQGLLIIRNYILSWSNLGEFK
jgi:hypothetical protein